VTFLTKDIRDHLAGSVEIANAFGERIHDGAIPQGINYAQAIVINLTFNDPEYYLGGESGTHRSIVQIDVWTDGNGHAVRLNELAELVRNRLSGYRGQFGEGCYGTSRMIRNDALSAPPVDGSNLHRRRQSMDFEIIHTADVPTFA